MRGWYCDHAGSCILDAIVLKGCRGGQQLTNSTSANARQRYICVPRVTWHEQFNTGVSEVFEGCKQLQWSLQQLMTATCAVIKPSLIRPAHYNQVERWLRFGHKYSNAEQQILAYSFDWSSLHSEKWAGIGWYVRYSMPSEHNKNSQRVLLTKVHHKCKLPQICICIMPSYPAKTWPCQRLWHFEPELTVISVARLSAGFNAT